MPDTPPTAARELHFTLTNGPVDETIDRLMALAGGIHRPRIVREMILAALKAGQEDERDCVDLKMMNHTLKEMRFTAKVFAPYRRFRKVSIFGSARITPDDPRYALARELGACLAREGFMVLTGGGPGIMLAVYEGAGHEASFVINIQLPFEQRPNPIVDGNPRSVNYKYFFNRKVAFLKEADAVVLLPGGFGTLDEGMETLTLIQTGKRDPIPVVLMDIPEGAYWHRWRKFIHSQLEAWGYIDPQDLSLVSYESDPQCVADRIHGFYRRYHSLRHVGGKLVLRLLSALSPYQIDALKTEFSDMLLPGGDMTASAALPEEKDSPAIGDLPRLVIDFDRRRFARLLQCIHRINDMD